jgi:anti-anti-sigma factor
MGQDTEIKLDQRGPVTIFAIQGDVTAASNAAFKQACEGVSGQAPKNIVLNFDPASYINSGGIAVIIQLLARAKQQNQTIGITGLSDHFKKIFQMVGITRFAKVYESVDEALAAMTTGS